ncbi:hypothetical protein KKA13_01800 [Patescibacteria group bacterium]|nr:hypothetical protein [Patescibacteria group bacterium]MBU1613197.1 hypothetical protein [Patescibacteria group bacterium]
MATIDQVLNVKTEEDVVAFGGVKEVAKKVFKPADRGGFETVTCWCEKGFCAGRDWLSIPASDFVNIIKSDPHGRSLVFPRVAVTPKSR